MRRVAHLVFALSLSFGSAQPLVNLGSAGTFGALSNASITNSGPTDIVGNIGTTGTSITGFPPGTFTGSEYKASQAITAFEAAEAAYQAVASMTGAVILTGNLGGRVLGPGVYKYSSSAQLSGVLTLAGTGSSDDAWYFQIGSTLTTASASEVLITGGGQPCNVFWQIGTSANLGIGSGFIGSVLAAVSITAGAAAEVLGGLFALGASITLNSGSIDAQYCALVTAPSSSSSLLSSTSSTASSSTTSSTVSSSSSAAPSSTSSSSSSSSSSVAQSSTITSSSVASSSSGVLVSSSPAATLSSSYLSSSSLILQSSSSNSATSCSSSMTTFSTSADPASAAPSSLLASSSSLPIVLSSTSSASSTPTISSPVSISLSLLPTSLNSTTSLLQPSLTTSGSSPTVSSSSVLSTTQALTTSTVYTTNVYTITQCPATVTNCPVGKVTTDIISLYTTICPEQSPTTAITIPQANATPVIPTSTPVTAGNLSSTRNSTTGKSSTPLRSPPAGYTAIPVGSSMPSGGKTAAMSSTYVAKNGTVSASGILRPAAVSTSLTANGGARKLGFSCPGLMALVGVVALLA